MGDGILIQWLESGNDCQLHICSFLSLFSLFHSSRSESNGCASGQGHLVVWTPISCPSVWEHVPLTSCCIPHREELILRCMHYVTRAHLRAHCQHAMFRKDKWGTNISVCKFKTGNEAANQMLGVYVGWILWIMQSTLFKCCTKWLMWTIECHIFIKPLAGLFVHLEMFNTSLALDYALHKISVEIIFTEKLLVSITINYCKKH